MDTVQLGNGRIDQLLVPALEFVGTLDDTFRVRLDLLDHLSQRGAGGDDGTDVGHALLDAVQLGPSPLIGLLEVEVCSREVARGERVTLPPDGIDRGGRREVVLA